MNGQIWGWRAVTYRNLTSKIGAVVGEELAGSAGGNSRNLPKIEGTQSN
ncbi:hypothetical protein SLEP1_g12539 [Rubroshorea leprosula]|uniref:Uncharacterized protein n=1 Tax=Rubroshorea leprosula TaxID=152421 RepID=A0AAV5IIW6_9ROSI|nr:hypothetical protein SLEP1_g12539 [Rubroshorea leprosula]